MKIIQIIPLLTIAFITVSCQPSNEEKIIADYKQTFAGTKYDLNFKIRSLEKIKVITTKDSAEILWWTFVKKRDSKLKQLSESIKDSTLLIIYKEQLEDAKINKANVRLIDYYETRLQEEEEFHQKLKNTFDLYNGNYKGTILEPLYLTIQQYETTPEKILATQYHAIFSMLNPNNFRIKSFERFFLNADRTKVLLSDQHMEYESDSEEF